MAKAKKVEMKVAEYVEMYNEKNEKKINRHDVYAMINDGTLKAHKNNRNAWIIEFEKPCTKCEKERTVKEFVEEYNKKHPKNTITVSQARKLIAEGKIKAEKVAGKYVVTQCARRVIK